MLAMRLTSLFFFCLTLACFGGDNLSPPIYLSFVEINYKAVSFEDLKKDPQKYSGAMICIKGFLGRDYDVNDSNTDAALYGSPFSKKDGPGSDILKLRLAGYYGSALFKFGFLRECKIYGIYFMTGPPTEGNDVCMLTRIDRVEGMDGTSIDFFAVFKKSGGK
ncbi:hypothetical protein BH09VER1_BH09VER1_37550 [soil metagenome]